MATITQPFAFTGAFTALITPFRDEAIDEVALRRFVEFQISAGIHGLVPCGTTGESVTLSSDEHDLVIDVVIDQAAGRVPVVAGVGSNSTAQSIERAMHAERAGADALLVVVPYYNKPTQQGMIAHFTAIADASQVPIVLYNVPGRTGVNMQTETILELATHPNIRAVKEASGNVDAASEIIRGAPMGFTVLSGDDSLTLPVMSVGGGGVISVASNIVPGEVADMVDSARSGDWARARRLHLQLFDLFRGMFIENNPAAVKTAAAILGHCAAELRLPLTALTPENRERLESVLREWTGFDREAA